MLSFFPLDVLDEIWDLIESVSEAFLTYSFRIFGGGARFRILGAKGGKIPSRHMTSY